MNAPLKHTDEAATTFVRRHIGPSPRDISAMLETVGARSLDELMGQTLPSSIRQKTPLDLGAPLSETEALAHMAELSAQNQVFTSLIGQGYSGTILPAVIQRNILENPAWYTAYTPYQPEISQGRLEALFNFQTMICDLTGLDVANASLLDEATAAAEAMALKDALKRSLPGRIVGLSVDSRGQPAYRLALQTREQHIRREKATSNICTAQVLLAVIASMYAVYHGPDGLAQIARRVHRYAALLAEGLRRGGVDVVHDAFFDTVRARVPARAEAVLVAARAHGVNLRLVDADTVGISTDELTTRDHLVAVWAAFRVGEHTVETLDASTPDTIPAELLRTSAYLTHPVFHAHRSETSMLRYLRLLSGRDYSLDWGMIPLGSCTMKLNAATEMLSLIHI